MCIVIAVMMTRSSYGLGGDGSGDGDSEGSVCDGETCNNGDNGIGGGVTNGCHPGNGKRGGYTLFLGTAIVFFGNDGDICDGCSDWVFMIAEMLMVGAAVAGSAGRGERG